MSKKARQVNQVADKSQGSGGTQIWWIIIPLVIFIAGAFAFYLNHAKSIAAAQEHVRRLQAENQSRGLPLDYPHDIVPLYDGAAIEETNRSTATAEDGTPLDQWTIVARVDGPPKPVYEYYKELMDAQGMQQMLFASIPKGYGIQYANEQYRVEYEIEKPLSTDTFTRLKIVIYRVR